MINDLGLTHTPRLGRAFAGFCLAASILATTCDIAETAPIPTPPKGHRVVDESHVLTSGEVRQLADKLKTIEDASGAQVAILTVPTAGDEGIAAFSNRVFVDWGLGHKGVDDGVLIVLATRDRRVRIEVGRGLEGNIPDVIAKRITADIMGPQFKSESYKAGFDAGIDALAARIDGSDAKPATHPVKTYTNAPIYSSDAGANPSLVILGVIIGGLTLLIALGYFLSRYSTPGRVAATSTNDSNRDYSSSSSSSSSSESSSSSNDSSGGGGDSAGGGSDSSY